MPIRILKADIKKHRPIDWFAIVILISFAFIVMGFLSNKIDEFNAYMAAEVKSIIEGFKHNL